MTTTKTTVLAALWMATAAATIGLAAPAHADDTPVNLPMTDDVRAELVQAGAVLTGRPASEFSGLRPGKTYYARLRAFNKNGHGVWTTSAGIILL